MLVMYSSGLANDNYYEVHVIIAANSNQCNLRALFNHWAVCEKVITNNATRVACIYYTTQ